MGETLAAHALRGAAQHRLRQIDADDLRIGRKHRQFESRADADVEDRSVRLGRRGGGGAAAGLQQNVERQIINRRPARIGGLDIAVVERFDFAQKIPCFAHRGALRPSAARSGGAFDAIVIAAGSIAAINPPPSTRASFSSAS